jgi:hypothetical protein
LKTDYLKILLIYEDTYDKMTTIKDFKDIERRANQLFLKAIQGNENEMSKRIFQSRGFPILKPSDWLLKQGEMILSYHTFLERLSRQSEALKQNIYKEPCFEYVKFMILNYPETYGETLLKRRQRDFVCDSYKVFLECK